MAKFVDVGSYTINLGLLAFIQWQNGGGDAPPRATLSFVGVAEPVIVEGEDWALLQAKFEDWSLDSEETHVSLYDSHDAPLHVNLTEGVKLTGGVIGTYEVEN